MVNKVVFADNPFLLYPSGLGPEVQSTSSEVLFLSFLLVNLFLFSYEKLRTRISGSSTSHERKLSLGVEGCKG